MTIDISVIVPVREDRATLERFLEYMKVAMRGVDAELIMVLNRPDTDGVSSLLRDAGGLVEVPTPASPYSARNRGLEMARGKHAAFIDATCLPDPDWLTTGLARLHAGEDLVAGRVDFSFAGEVPAAAELWDSVTNVQQERSVVRGVGKTANLFVSRRALELLGPFREGVRSGEDVRWTGQCTAHGLALSYCPEAVVCKRARPFGGLVRKALRVGAGQAAVLSRGGRLIRIAAAPVTPPSPKRIARAMRALPSGHRTMSLVVRIVFVGWCVQVAQAAGLIWPGRFREAD
jgi:hypothetical protein